MDRVPFIGCINLVERDDRYRQVLKEFEKAGIADRVHWHRPVRHPDGGRVGCFESHLEIQKAALKADVPFALVFEDDVRLTTNWQKGISKLMELVDSGVPWRYASLQNSGCEGLLTQDGDKDALPDGVVRAAFVFTRCYAITRAAMEDAVAKGITRAHADIALAGSNWGSSFVIRPSVVRDVPSKSDNDWGEGGLQCKIAGQMQSFTHLPCVVMDRYRMQCVPRMKSSFAIESCVWRRFEREPAFEQHVDPNLRPKHATRKKGVVLCGSPN